MLWKAEEGVNTNNSNNTNGADVKSAKGVEIYNCCFEPAYTIQHIVEAMKKVTGLTQFVPDIPNWVIMPMLELPCFLLANGYLSCESEEAPDFDQYLW